MRRGIGQTRRPDLNECWQDNADRTRAPRELPEREDVA